MIAASHIFQIHTQGKGTYPLDDMLLPWISEHPIVHGVAHIFVQHTSCSLIIMENADSSARADLHKFFDKLVLEDEPYYTHTYEGADDMPSHIRMVLTGCSHSIPIVQGKLAMGTWQGLYLFEHRYAPHTRNIAISILGI